MKGTRAIFWLLTAAPILACLAWTLAWPAAAPEPGALRAALGEHPLPLSWSGWSSEAAPHFLSFRAATTGLLQAGDYPAQAVTCWLLALFTLLVAARLTVRSGVAPARAVLPVAAALLFAPAFGTDWLVAARLRLFLVPLLTLIAAWLLVSGRRFTLRFLGAAVLATLATAVDTAGVLSWFALAPVVAGSAALKRPEPDARPRPVPALITWIILANVVVALVHFGAARRGFFGHLFDAPGDVGVFLLETWGRAVPDLLPWPPIVQTAIGALLALLALALLLTLWRARGDSERLRAALPFTAPLVFALMLPLALCDQAFAAGLSTAALRELAWGAALLPLAIIGSAAALWPTTRATLCIPALGALWLLALQDGYRGIEALEDARDTQRQLTAVQAVWPAARDLLPPHALPPLERPEDVAALRAMGHLRRVPQPAALDPIALLAEAEDAPAPGAVTAVTAGKGGAILRGTLDARFGHLPPPLLMVTARRGSAAPQLVALVLPDFNAGTGVLPWQVLLPSNRCAPGDTLEVFGMAPETGATRRLEGQMTVPRGNGR